MRRLNNRTKGRQGEERAEEYLKTKGYNIIERNYSNRFGEIDIIARDGSTLVFIEVKTRNSSLYGFPADAVDAKKQSRIGRVALSYISDKKFTNHPCRFDVLSIHEDRIELFMDAFDLPDDRLW
ncbi:MAG: YraN family protein [Nitrospirae bacterium]|nr:YraN family protein [Nitrospirota bacterium]